MDEKWLPCDDKDISNYEISDKGRVRNQKTGKVLKTKIDKRGYEIARINGKTKKIHKIVAKTFHGDKSDILEAYHRDGDKTKNQADNIAWGTRSEIIKNAYIQGNLKPYRNKSLMVVETGETYESINECSKATGINPATISKCLNYPNIYKNRKNYHFIEIDGKE